MKINAKIKAFLKTKGISNSEVASKFGTSQQNISKYLTGKSIIPLDFIVWIAKEYNDFDLERMILDEPRPLFVGESSSQEKELTKAQILEEIGKILDKYL